MGNSMGKEYLHGLMDQSTMVNTRMVRSKVMGDSSTLTKKYMMASGWMVSRKDRDLFLIKMDTF